MEHAPQIDPPIQAKLLKADGTISEPWRAYFKAKGDQADMLQRAMAAELPAVNYADTLLFGVIFATVGTVRGILDSTTDVWGAVIAGGGTKKVLAYFNGSNWTVAGK